ncbi:bifunctional 2-C-methyl-D-erythritol 4-phosphate cytidylyltransferase/2-C-methyl-D-erythritol 2,4-cyclodiphosphate synthase [Profundibacter amoris]|uniref:Bifunctional enzyme IspD/IspF n=1 Tax=Profundibacter amoris TaxID=2171755 RepID=A0A347ULL8_9RHOB|nr:bifunctional 2-C-methyl-D-erythritol 4-phosphate cytidylyltransferase/2-C-methyl-D-erythritol 2,4-cyclodiphosphate synthase [Profundibacter amoris]AXX99746.1 bifunctional 2-C-methyl-D-erythritol 4-phosphate cytidylyltransferase/2-C-methyl-D-erythritol 2,4-cyclodiphosphate synthase [Profundibacter amoris]
MKTAAIIVAAGRGIRAGGELPKQFQPLRGRIVLEHSIAAFSLHPQVDRIILVINPDDRDLLPALPDVELVDGGATRDASVQAGLNAAKGADLVLIHDAARPLVSQRIITDVLDALKTHAGAAPALPVTDALWRGKDGQVQAPHPREGLFRAQTPQGFHLNRILAAHAAHNGGALDDVEVALTAGLDVAIVTGDAANMKITMPGDFTRAEQMMEQDMDIRLGNGYDVHRFCDGDHVVLCGVKLPHSHGLDGHSDADVGMHAVTDAIYGALAMGDIGQHFPPSDPQWKGAASFIFLEHAVKMVGDHGFTISNVDCTLVCEMPKIGPHAVAMRREMARIMGMDTGRVSVKATTSEQLGFTGRKEGIAALATVTLVKI